MKQTRRFGKWGISICLGACFCSTSNAQLLDNTRGMLAVEDVIFNQAFLSRNGISEISEKHQIKRPGKAISNKLDAATMRFDSQGLLTEHFRVSSSSGEADTIHRRFSYTENGIDRILKIQGNQFHEELILIKNDTVYIRSHRLTEASYSGTTPQELIWLYDEKLAIEKSQNRSIYTRYNNEGLPYLKTVIRKDSSGFLLEENEQFLVTRQQKTTSYQYERFGHIWQRQVLFPNGKKERWEFLYDDSYNVIEVQYYRNEELLTRMEFLYTTMGLLDATLKQQQDTKNIDIVRYSYKYHPSKN
jgi:hypothetical protein